MAFDGTLFVEGGEAFDGVFAGTVEIDALAALDTSFGSFQAFARGGGEVGDADVTLGFSRIGGFQRLSGVERDAFAGDVAGVVGVRAIASSDILEGVFGVSSFVGASGEFGGAFDGWSDVGQDGGFFAGSVFAGVKTRLGPFYVGLGHAEAGNNAFYLGFGERF